jgi:energy-coupling factor transporter ATP-binding protein EcfA2
VAPPSLWRSEFRLELREDLGKKVRRRVIATLEEAWRSLDDAGLKFGARSRWPVWPGASFVTAAELAAILPQGTIGNAEAGPTASPGLALGRTSSGSPVEIPVDADQGRHLAVLGETGMGKSSLLVALAARAAEGAGVVVLDPLGETARAIRSEIDPTRVLWIAPGASARGLNALEGLSGSSDPVAVERRITDLVNALRRVRSGRYADSSFWGPRLEEMLTRAVRAAAAFPGGTLADAHTLLATLGRSRRVVPPAAEEALRELADRVRERPEDADGARRLLYEVVRNPTLDRMLCARTPELSANELVRPGRVALVSGEAARVGEVTARYLLAVYLALLWSEILAVQTPRKLFVILDEAQWFAHESLSEMLRLARRRNVHVVLATQTLGSLPDAVRESVWTNVADFVAFRGSPDEAREFSRAAAGVPVDRILSLSRGEALLLVGKGREVHWVRTVRLPGDPRPGAAEGPESTSAGGRPTSSAVEQTSGTPESSMEAAEPAADTVDLASAAEDLVRELWTKGAGAPAGELVRVALERFRTETGLGPELVRRVGARLGRAGAIVRTTRGPEGAVWWLDPARIPAPQDRCAATPLSGEDSAAPQPS